MNKDRRDKLISGATIFLLAACLIGSITYYDIPSYELQCLKGVNRLLTWSYIGYFPLFPLLDFFFLALITPHFSPRSLLSINFMITLFFTVIAYLVDTLEITWTFVAIGSFLLMLCGLYDDWQAKK